MKRTYEEWLKYYENATKEQVIEDTMHDMEKIQRLNNIIKDVYEFVEWHYKDNQEFYKNKGIGLNYPECDYVLNKLKELKEGNKQCRMI